jgi:hypothetical protein
VIKIALADWLLSDIRLPKGIQHPEPVHAWWRVMCLTGVDYFSTLGYQPGIAFLAAGLLSPIATFVLVLVTLFAALPLYSRVAGVSPNGQGSIAMLEKLFPKWGGKAFVLVLLGFASTDFIITMTLSAADAAAHFIHNPYAPNWLSSQMLVTLLLLIGLGAIFLKGFKEAIGIAVVLVGIYLVLNAIVTVVAFDVLFHSSIAFSNWKRAVFTQHPSLLGMIGLSLLLFPKLALGLSGFETGVAVMPLIGGKNLEARIRNTRKLLSTAAITMSVFLMATSIVTTLLIPAQAFAEGGEANGRAMAFLAHRYIGNGFGTLYDVSTILILAFAGASAMAGLLNLIPRYLPRLGMAPEWALAARPLVLVFMSIHALADAYSTELRSDDETYDFFNKTSAIFAPIPGDQESLGNSYAMFTPMSAAHNMFTELFNLVPFLREQAIERAKRDAFDEQVTKLIRESEVKWQEICTSYSVLRTKYLAAL